MGMNLSATPAATASRSTSPAEAGTAWLNTKAAAAYLGLSKSSLDHLRSEKEARPGPAFTKLGRAVRYSVDDLEAYARANMAKAA